ncbi:unnamed protein product [Enterobius vermicularis]|uniref:CxC3 domain-containing protein n=1 Tax=Enterobius vermicularis TaxID=51028 RepID=A0A0N4UWX2_ENTVE|nr:unnamed protein product [Enterobius vermicularis]
MAVDLVEQKLLRQNEKMRNLKAQKPSPVFKPQRFLATNTSACPQPNATMFTTLRQQSSLSQLTELLQKHLEQEDETCNGPPFRALNTITKHQFWGFTASFLTNYATPLCFLCHSVLSKIEEKIFTPNPFIYTEEERHMMRRVFAHVPNAQAICSMLIPSCYHDYKTKVSILNGTSACLQCPLCTTALSMLQHRFLLSPTALEDTLNWLLGNLFHNICAELCLECLPDPTASEPPCGFFPNGSDYNKVYNFFWELEWCKVNESPNILNCLREICQDDTVCKLIPTDPKLAEKFVGKKTEL